MRFRLLGLFCVWLCLIAEPLSAKRLELAWPTPNRAFIEGQPIAAFAQPTVSGDPASGLFGCVRNSGSRFHEGVDLLPLKRTARGEPADPIYAAMPGVVRHINTVPGNSNYGRYIVLEHTESTPPVYTLYAHLSAIADGLRENDTVRLGQVIATMGHSASGSGIPKSRAHLHFEMGLRLSDQFEQWYRKRKFGTPNRHGLWNGMNLAGFDPIEFYGQFQRHEIDDVIDYLQKKQAQVVLRVALPKTPDFVRRYPQLAEDRGVIASMPAGWEISVDSFGLPFHWRPLTSAEVAGYRKNEVRVLSVNEAERTQHHCKRLVVKRGTRYLPGRDLNTLLELLLGLP